VVRVILVQIWKGLVLDILQEEKKKFTGEDVNEQDKLQVVMKTLVLEN